MRPPAERAAVGNRGLAACQCLLAFCAMPTSAASTAVSDPIARGETGDRRDSEERRERILATARRLFSEHRYSAVSTTRIADEAGVARGLINHYFGTKHDLYVEVVREMVRFRAQPVPEYVDGATPEDRLSESIDAWLEMVARNREAWLAAIGAEGLGRDPEIEAVLDAAREKATVRMIEVLGLGPAAEAPPELQAALRAYGGMAEAATREWLERDRWSRPQVAAFLKAALPRLVGEAYEAIPDRETPTTTSKRSTDSRGDTKR